MEHCNEMPVGGLLANIRDDGKIVLQKLVRSYNRWSTFHYVYCAFDDDKAVGKVIRDYYSNPDEALRTHFDYYPERCRGKGAKPTLADLGLKGKLTLA